MNILAVLRERFSSAITDLVEDQAPYLDQIRPSGNPKFGDYQANLAMPLAKKLGRPAPQLAAEIASNLVIDDMCETPEVAGNGFINLRLKDQWLDDQLRTALQDDRLGVARVAQPICYVIDFSSPNVAKPMHVGHIRSTVIGDAIARTLRFLGHNVITDNHLGDWGTQFGMIIYGFKHFGNESEYERDPVSELTRLYREVRRLMDYHAGKTSLAGMQKTVATQAESIENLQTKLDNAEKAEKKKLKKEIGRLREKQQELQETLSKTEALIQQIERVDETREFAARHVAINTAVLEETAKLHAGDAENLALWKRFMPCCMEDLHRIYRKLDVQFDHELGESFYQDQLAGVVEEFENKQLAKESEGAMCVFLDGFETPMLIRKQDGAYLYATSDLATIQYRMKKWQPDVVLYVVDHRQHEHFEKLFAAARIWGFDKVDLRHLAFGTVMGEDRRPFKTRSGETVGLESLVDEAVSRALAVVETNSAQAGKQIDEESQRRIAEIVGIGALKYADLSQNRSTDYVFSYDNMLAMQGNTGPYLQYSYARNQGIFSKAGMDPATLRQAPHAFVLESPEERTLALALLRFEETLHEVLVDFRPNILCNYVYQLSKAYSVFFDRCPVIKAESDALRMSRLELCDLTARTVKQSLELLGIQVAERM